jgi:hypothetical protein
MTTAIDRLRDYYEDGVLTLLDITKAIAGHDALAADRDRLAARVDELEQVIARYDDTEDFARVRATPQHIDGWIRVFDDAAAKVPIDPCEDEDAHMVRMTRAGVEALVRKAQAMRPIAVEAEKPRDADPCPVTGLTLETWTRGVYVTDNPEGGGLTENETREVVRQIAWLTRQVLRAKEGV